MPTKPPFDPSQPFTKPPFDPNAPFEEHNQNADKERMSNKFDADQFRQRMQQNPEVAETPYGKGPQQGLEQPTLDPIDLAPAIPGSQVMKAGLGAVAEKTGLSQIPGRLMSSAVGMKYIPKVAQTLVDEGLMGTKGAMQGQIAQRLPQRAQDLEQAVSSIPGRIDSTPIGEKVGNLVSKYQTPQGVVPDAAKPEFASVLANARDIVSRGQVSPSEALAFKRIAAEGAYSARDKPLASLTAKLGQTESAGYGQALEKAYGEANPGEVNAVQEANDRLSALIRGNKALKSATPSPGVAGVATDLGIAGAGVATGHTGAGISAVLAKHAMQSPLVKSTAAQGVDLAGKALTSTPATAAGSISLQQYLNSKLNK